MSNSYVVLVIFMGFLATFGGRILPYILFRRKSEGKNLAFIQRNMPLVIMVVLVFYTLFGIDLSDTSKALSAAIACISTLTLQICFKNALVSMFSGTCLYMILLRIFL